MTIHVRHASVLLSNFLVFALASTGHADAAETRVEQLDENLWRMTLIVEGSASVDDAQAALGPAVSLRCGSRTPYFLDYEFAADQRLDAPASGTGKTIILKQLVQCGGNPPSLEMPSSMPFAAVGDSPEARMAALARFNAYTQAFDNGDFEGAFAMQGAEMKAMRPLGEFKEQGASFRTAAGEAKPREVRRVTWYTNPDGAPRPGDYVAVDYVGDYRGLALQCGYVMLYRTGFDTFEIVREESGHIDHATAAKLDPAQWSSLESAFGCVPKSVD